MIVVIMVGGCFVYMDMKSNLFVNFMMGDGGDHHQSAIALCT